MITTLVTGISALLPPEPSNRLRLFMANAFAVYDRSVLDLLTELGLLGAKAASTIGRAFSREETVRIRDDHLSDYIGWLARYTGVGAELIREWIFTGVTSDPTIRMLAAAKVFPHTTAGLAEWNQRLIALQEDFKEACLLTEIPSASMIPKEASPSVCRLQAYTPQRLRIESAFAKKRRDQMELQGERLPNRSTQIVSRCGVEKMMKGIKRASDRDQVVETLIDRHRHRVITLGYIDDRPGQSGEHLGESLKQFDMRGVFEGTVSVRRERTGLRRYLYVASESPAQNHVVEEDREVICAAKRVAVFDTQTILDWLMEFSSPSSYLRMRRDSYGEFEMLLIPQ